MSFAPPPGPPPPPVPPGWKAQFDDRYKQWFFVNLKTGVSQWEPPDAPATDSAAPPSEPPPSYDQSGPANPDAVAAAGDKKSNLGSNNPYKQPSESATGSGGPSHSIEDDARLAAQLQAEEDARAAAQRKSPAPGGASAEYYNQAPPPSSTQPGGYPPHPPPSDDQQQQRSSGSKGFLGKLLGKSSWNKHSGHPPPQQSNYPPPHPGYGYPPPQNNYPPP
ncbi:WW domain protein, partial [Rasamsonia emersonii CBS 393.64]